ncbi:T9SS type B sorting domain-containing protein [Flagellimonas allohymeniacidonis]|uniref:T9SS type B sorting domain-containing protein n=1 Tax=Flagellimonas allohymeniacidonis TaxID=2517819 RepID=A0A4Q8QHT6_9FLAO|nr:T9SS type B sorting domain-containing protein [Allomuricauda hymeniacidonis]TAI49524.1 T9SS type B sorting domain-containing protein [Allomuricauda hymeniacidonis]
MVRLLIKVICLVFFCPMAFAQVAADCASAIPICNNTPINEGANGYGIDDFNGATSTGCLETSLSGFIESNSVWYRFRTSASGQLGFNIGHANNEDWDFALYRASSCSALGDPIRCNFFDNGDGTSYTGVGEHPDGGQFSIYFEDWVDVAAGEDYFLLINNFSNTNSGFSIQFTGNIFATNPNDALDCSIISNLLGPPVAACEGDSVPLDATTVGATGYSWYQDLGSGFQPISGETNATYNATVSAIYRVVVTTATGSVVSDVQIGFNPIPVTEALSHEEYCWDSTVSFDLGAKDAEALGTQNPNDFRVSYHSSQSDAELGINPLPKMYPKTSGSEIVYVRTTSLANPDCYDALESFELNALELPELSFPEEVSICEDSAGITIGETLPNPGYTYAWDSGESTPTINVTQAGAYTLTVTNSSGTISCPQTRTVQVSISNAPAISDIEIDDLNTNNVVTVLTEVEGNFEYQLDDGVFQSSNIFQGVAGGMHTVTMRDTLGCGEVTENFVVVGFSAIFSPNGDVLNETWHIEGLSELNSPVITIYDRYGKLITQLNEFDAGWDGNLNGNPLPSTDYWFKLSYLDNDGNRVLAKYLRNHFSLKR